MFNDIFVEKDNKLNPFVSKLVSFSIQIDYEFSRTLDLILNQFELLDYDIIFSVQSLSPFSINNSGLPNLTILTTIIKK